MWIQFLKWSQRLHHMLGMVDACSVVFPSWTYFTALVGSTCHWARLCSDYTIIFVPRCFFSIPCLANICLGHSRAYSNVWEVILPMDCLHCFTQVRHSGKDWDSCGSGRMRRWTPVCTTSGRENAWVPALLLKHLKSLPKVWQNQ